METASGKETINVLRRLITFGEDLPPLPGHPREDLGPEAEAAHLYSSGSKIVDGVVLGQVGKHQCLGTGRPRPLLAALVGRADI